MTGIGDLYLLYNQALPFRVHTQAAQAVSVAGRQQDCSPAWITGLHFPSHSFSAGSPAHHQAKTGPCEHSGSTSCICHTGEDKPASLRSTAQHVSPLVSSPLRTTGKKHFTWYDSLVDVSTKEEPRKVAASITRAKHFLLFLRSR